jgi:transcriptional regulator with XRE-family HTH domain
MLSAGQSLRQVREQLDLTLREVESASARIADKHGNDAFAVSPSRLSDIETKGLVPSIYRLYSLAVIYRRDLREILSWYDIDLNATTADMKLNLPPKSHPSKLLQGASVVHMPIRLDSAFDPNRTNHLGRMVEQWGLVPLAYLAQFASDKYTYCYVGREDFTMYPILPPGTFLQVDESRNKILPGMWRSEYERPIYFVETREGYTCCWCSLKGDHIILQPHPLSPVPVRVLRHPEDAEVIGQVIGMAVSRVACG